MCIDKNNKSNHNKYIEYLKGKIEWEPGLYLDPDREYNSEYYENIVAFLNKQEENLIKESKRYHYELIKDGEADGEKQGFKIPPSIAVYEKKENNDKNPFFFLRSDLFGFSAPREKKEERKIAKIAGDERYPYASYLLKSKEEELDESAKFIANTIWKTRNIGGVFLWPLCKRETDKRITWFSSFNMRRGVKSYIEDSVDLTLWEIKQMYCIGKDSNAKTKSDLIISGGADKELIFQWLCHFDSFENYVKFFAFENFVSEEKIIDITSKEREGLNSSEVDKYRKEFSKNSQNGRIRRMEKENLELLLKNIAELIEARTEAMNMVIGKKSDKHNKSR